MQLQILFVDDHMRAIVPRGWKRLTGNAVYAEFLWQATPSGGRALPGYTVVRRWAGRFYIPTHIMVSPITGANRLVWPDGSLLWFVTGIIFKIHISNHLLFGIVFTAER
ncbi:MAG: hypothetical protein KDD15_28450, partial [Lewinella sp.]|nr:hypothetical protein [Lewinella sp.]